MEIINVADQIIEVNVTNDIVNIQAQTGAYPLPNNVYSVFGRVGNVVATEGDYTLTQLADVTLTSPASGQVLKYNGTAWVNGADNNSVTSVFGRTGVVTAQSGDYTSLQVTENTNLYFTNQRARFAISGDSNSGVVYQNTTGIIALDDIPNTSLLNDKVTINTKNVALGGSLTLSTTDIGEGTNLYFTNARAQNALTYGNLTSGDMDVSGGTAAVIGTGASLTLKNVNSNVGTYGSSTAIPVISVNAKGLVTGVTTDAVFIPSGALSFIGDVTGTGNTGSDTTLTLKNVNSNVGSYGTSTSVPTIQVNAKGLVTAASQTAIPTAASGTTGLLTSTDYNTFKGKQDALNGTGFVKINGTTISYDNSTYLTTISGIAAGGELSGTYANPSLVNSAVTGKVLTGLNLTPGGTIADTDTILGAFGKVQNQISALVGGVMYQGTWNASTNSPSITSSVGTKGYYYIVSVAGSTNINGITDWKVGDWIIFNGSTWDKVDNTDAVSSVNGYTGAVSLTTTDIAEGTNEYFTTTRARAANSAGTGISYSAGVITNTAPDQVVALSASGTTTITGTYPNFTISSADQYTGSVTSVGLTMPSAFAVSGSPISNSGVFSVTATGDTTQYIAGDGSLVSFPIAGQAGTIVRQVRNQTGATLTKGTIVYISGASGNKALVSKAIATGDSTSAQTFGLVQADITNNQNGYVVCAGDLTGLNTLAFTEGTQLYLSSTTAGEYTSTKQYAPNHLVYIGVVTRSHANQGQIEVKIQNGYELDELHNVAAQSPSNGDILQYVSSTNLWTKTAGTTSNISEGSNLYYTQSRFDTAFGNKTTSNLTEGTNLYYTDARSRASIALTTTGSSGASTYNSTTGALNIPTYTLAGLGGINLTSLSATSPLLYDNTTGVFSIQQASGSQAGFLSAADWTTFNGKQSALGYTPVPTTRTLTINGTAYDLSADRSWTITPNVNATNTQDFTATAAQTTFTVTGGYTVGQLAVFYNGSKLAAAEYTATNGTTFVLATACQANDIVQAVVSVTGGGIGGSGTTNYISKWTASGVLGNSLIFDNGTNVGIGNTNTSFTFDVTGTGRFTDTLSIDTSVTMLRFGNLLRWGFQRPAADNRYVSFMRNMNATAIPVITMDGDNGNVGISTSTPSARLDVRVPVESPATGAVALIAGTSNGSNDIFRWFDGATQLGVFKNNGNILLKDQCVLGLNTSDGSDNGYLAIAGAGADGDNRGAYIYLSGNERPSDAGSLVLAAGNSGSNGIIQFRIGAGVERMRIFASGNIRFSSQVYGNTVASPRTLYIQSDGELGGISSIRESKTNISELDSNWLMQLNPVSFNYRKKDEDGKYTDEYYDELFYGLIAEETELVNKEICTYNDDKLVGIEYSKLVPVLVKAIQELKAELDSLKQLVK
jgi:hypothetical protein